MRRSAIVAVILAALPGVGTAALASSRASLSLTPATVHRGELVLIRGSAPGCAAGNTVFIISRAFRRIHDFAGVPAVLAKVRADGRFRTSTRIPHARHPGRYTVTARCGGGNLGVAVKLVVLR